MDSRDDEDAGHIRWQFDHCSYLIFFCGEQGQKHRTFKGINILHNDVLDKPFDDDDHDDGSHLGWR